MRSRRLPNVITMLLMAHLSVVRSDFVCAEHGTEEAHTAHEAQTIAAARSHDHGPSADASGSEAAETPCEIPTRPQCCEALASCTMSLAASRGSRRIDVRDPTLGVAAAASRVPRSNPAGPEPPPPRA